MQGSLILKILRGKYPPVTGYSKELTDIVKSCLTLVHASGGSTRLLRKSRTANSGMLQGNQVQCTALQAATCRLCIPQP